MTEPTDAEIVAFSVETGMRVRTGKGAIKFARAVLAKWGTPPAVAGEHKPGCPALGGYGHGVEDCCCGATPQPTQAQAVPLSDDRLLLERRFAISSLFHLIDRWAGEKLQHYQLMNELGQIVDHVIRRTEEAHGIKGGQHAE